MLPTGQKHNIKGKKRKGKRERKKNKGKIYIKNPNKKKVRE